MRRRRFLSLVAAAPLGSGCSTISSSGGAKSPTEDSILATRDPPSREELPTNRRPPAEDPPDATEDTVSPRSYPTRPTEYTDQSVRTFVRSYELAYRRNDLLERRGNTLVSQSSSFDWTVTLDVDGDAGIGRCKYRYSETTRENGDTIVGDSATNAVTYYVDDSMIVRARDTGSVDQRGELHPDPWESGIVLEPSE